MTMNTETHKDTQSVIAYLHQFSANYNLCFLSELCREWLIDNLAGSSKAQKKTCEIDVSSRNNVVTDLLSPSASQEFQITK